MRSVYLVIYGTLLIHPLPTSRVSCLQEGYSRGDDNDDDGEDCDVDNDDDDDDDDEDEDDDDEYYYGQNRTEFAIKVVYLNCAHQTCFIVQ